MLFFHYLKQCSLHYSAKNRFFEGTLLYIVSYVIQMALAIQFRHCVYVMHIVFTVSSCGLIN